MQTRLALALALTAAALTFSSARMQGQQACTLNATACENQLPGNPQSEWDISGSGDPNLQGFATEISVNKGDTVRFKVDTTAASYNLTIYRLGYYGGLGARRVASQTALAGIAQSPCLTQTATGLIDCGNWIESTTWTVPSNAVSGIYVAKLTRTGSSGSHIVFVVRDDVAPADVVVQTSDTTWQAYNTYGGSSLYAGGPGTNPSRAYKVSYNRPITTRGTSPEDFVFNAEYPMVRWLEANGYNVSYITGADTDRSGGTELPRHRVFVAVGHDEYWSAAQRQHVEAARDAGVNLAFLTGNGIFWKTRWEPSIDGTATPYRTLVSYKETHNNGMLDPADPPTWTGTWRDPRFSPPADGGRPENALMGTIFTVNWGGSGSETWAIEVPQTFASQPFWRNTRIATLPVGGKATLAAGTLGYEWDENLNNGFRPAGLTTLSSTTRSVAQRIQDYGSTYGTGTATHALTLYRSAVSNALVFGAGTVQWSWGLDGHHDRGGSTPDVAMQQATVNLLSDMGVQPASLQAGLVSGTATPAPDPVPAALANLAIDATAAGDRTTASSTVTTTAFSTVASGELLLAFVSGGWVSGSTTSVSSIAGGGLTWQRVVRTNAQRGTAEVWRAFASAPLTNITVTATLSLSVPSSLTVISFTGADASGANGAAAIGATASATSASGAPSATLTSTRNNSWVFGVGTDATAATARTLGSNQTMVHQLLATAATDTYWVQRRTTATAAAGTSVRINDTAPTADRFNLSTVEILPATVAPPPPPPPPNALTITSPTNGATVTNTVTVNASTPAGFTAVGVQFAVDGTNVGPEDTAAPYAVTFTAASGAHSLTAVARDAGGATTAAAPVNVTVSAGSGTALTINGAQTFQTMDGLGVNMNSLSWKNGEAKPAIDLLVDQLGAGTFRVIFDMEDWEDPNDNADSASADPAYYTALYGNAKFQNLWGTLHYLNQRGVTSGIVLSFMGRVPVWMGGSVINTASEDEWCEMVATLLDYARNTEHVQFTLLDPLNETDNDGIEGPRVSAAQFVRLLNKLAQKLDAMNLNDIRFVAPSTAFVSNLASYLNPMLQDPVVMAKLAHFSLHDYSGSTGGADAFIKASGYPSRNFWMTEGGSTNDVLAFIGQGASSVQWWEAYDSVYNHAILHGQVSPGTCPPAPTCTTTPPNDNFGTTVGLIAYNQSTGVYTPRKEFYQEAQLGRYVPPGSVRIGASQSNGSLTMYAFYQAGTGRITIVGRNTSSSAIAVNGTISGLPAISTLQLSRTDGSSNFLRGSDAAVTSGKFYVSAPANSFFTLTTLAQPDTTAPAVSMTSPANGSTVTGSTTVTAGANDAGGVAGVQFLLDNAPFGAEDTTAPYSVTWSPAAAANGSHALSAIARDAAGNTTTAVAITVTVNIGAPPPPATAPTIDVTVFGDRSSSGSIVTTSAFTTHAANELLLAFVGADDISAGNTVTGVTGGSLTWQLVVRTNTQRGDAEIWRAFAPGVLTSVTVTATLAQAAASSITVMSFTGIDPSGTNGSGAIGAVRSASASTGAPTATVTTTRSNSLVIGVGTDWDSATGRTLGSGQTLVHQYLATVGDTYWVQRTSALVAASGTSVTINDTAPTGDRFNLSVCEVLGPP